MATTKQRGWGAEVGGRGGGETRGDSEARRTSHGISASPSAGTGEGPGGRFCIARGGRRSRSCVLRLGLRQPAGADGRARGREMSRIKKRGCNPRGDSAAASSEPGFWLLSGAGAGAGVGKTRRMTIVHRGNSTRGLRLVARSANFCDPDRFIGT
jgi:hypothetical protein